MGFEDDLAPLLEATASALGQHPGPIREREMEEALVAAHAAGAYRSSISNRAPLSLNGFRGVGNCDVAVIPTGEQMPILLELKWGAGTLYNCAWDAVKLALALREGRASEAHMVAGAPLSDWDDGKRGADLFESTEWMTRDFMTAYAKEFAFWRRVVKTRPEILPRRFSTRKGTRVDLEISGFAWSLRSAQVAQLGGGSVAVDADGEITSS